MRVVGFGLKKISGERIAEKMSLKPSTSIEFTDLKHDKVDLLKEGEAIKISFLYSVIYGDEKKKAREGEITFGGEVVLSVNKEESKEIEKAWKKKKLPESMNIVLFNLILRKCTPKAIFLEDEINLPFHTPMPRLEKKREE